MKAKFQNVPKSSGMALYLMIANELRRRIAAGSYGLNKLLPSIEILMEEFDVGRVTVRQAIGKLEEEGLVLRKQGKGTFILRVPLDNRMTMTTKWSEMIKLMEGTSIKLIHMSDGVELPTNYHEYGKPFSEYILMRRIHMKNDIPYAHIDIYLSKDIFQQKPKAFKERTVLSVFQELPDLKISRAFQFLTIKSAGIDSAHQLQIEPDLPVANVQRTVLDHTNRIIYLGDIIYRGDYVRFDISFDLTSDD